MISNANLGIDLLLDGDGDLALSPTGDLALTATGRVCLLQDVKHLLDTLPGDLFSHTDYGAGLPRLFGEEDQSGHGELVKRAIADALTYDPSVAPRIEPETIEVERIATGNSRAPGFKVSFVPLGESSTNRLNIVYNANWTGGDLP